MTIKSQGRFVFGFVPLVAILFNIAFSNLVPSNLALSQVTMTKPSKEGKASFNVPGLTTPCETWYKIFGDLADTSKTPLIVVHGGPGACHEYLLPFGELSVPVVLYDQIGNGRSTVLPEKDGDEAFWTVRLFCDELTNLITHLGLKDRPIDLLGHSWGGMLVAVWASEPSRAGSLRRLVISNSPAGIETHRIGLDRLQKQLPSDMQEAIKTAIEKNEYTSPEYQAAENEFHQRHLSLTRPYPCPEAEVAFGHLSTSAVYNTTFGPSELNITGSLRDWTSVPILHKIKAPTLLINGAQDEVQDVTMQPFFDHIPKVKWITLDDAAHFSYIEQREKYFERLEHFLK